MKKKLTNRFFIFAVELVVIVLLVLRLFGTNEVTEYTFNDFNVQNGVIDGDCLHIDEDTYKDYFTLGPIGLKAGDYDIEISYNAQGSGHFLFSDIEDHVSGYMEEKYGQLMSDTIKLASYQNTAVLRVGLKQDTGSFLVKCIYGGGGFFDVYSIKIRETLRDEIRALCSTLFILTVVNLIIVYGKNLKSITVSGRKVIISLAAVIFVASLGFFLPYLISGHDLIFHLLRIEGVKDCILTGQVPAKVQPNWLDGNGYAVSIFYGDLFLYIPAFLRILGYSVTTSYCVYGFLVNLATCLISYFCFKGITKNKKAAVFGSAIYTLNIYRLINMYVRSAAGEYTAMTFFPLVAYGLWKIFSEDENSDGYKYNFILPVIGYTGLIQSHIISCELAGIFTIITCIAYIKKVFKPKRFMVLCTVVVMTVVVNAGFLIPFFKYMGEAVQINTTANYKSGIQFFGAFWPQIFEFFTAHGGLASTAQTGIAGDMPVTVGYGCLAGGGLLALMFLLGDVKREDKKKGAFLLICGAMSVFMSTIYFPWDSIQSLADICAKVVTSFQFPWRFLSMSMVFLSLAAVLAFKQAFDHDKYRKLAYGIVVAAVVQALWLICGILNDAESRWAYYEGALDTKFLVGCEYLPIGHNAEHYAVNFVMGSDGVSCRTTDRTQNIIDFDCSNYTGSEGYVATSLVYYSDYKALGVDSDMMLETYNENGYLYVRVPDGVSGSFRLKFVQPFTWYVSYVVSVLGAAFMIFAIFMQRRKKHYEE